jgi:hypothetical protein
VPGGGASCSASSVTAAEPEPEVVLYVTYTFLVTPAAMLADKIDGSLQVTGPEVVHEKNTAS